MVLAKTLDLFREKGQGFWRFIPRVFARTAKPLSEGEGVGELLQGLFQNGAGEGDIEAHEAFAARAEAGAVVQGEVSTVEEEMRAAVELVAAELTEAENI